MVPGSFWLPAISYQLFPKNKQGTSFYGIKEALNTPAQVLSLF